MTEQEAINLINNLPEDDPESAHVYADEAVMEFLKANGFSGLAEAWVAADEDIGFWYA